MGKREANIYDLDEQNLRIDPANYNPIFALFMEEFDKLLRGRGIDDEYILDNCYADTRGNSNVTNEALFRHFQKLNLIRKNEDFVNGICSNIGMIYLLLGKKGIGKTTFLKYFCRKYCQLNKYTKGSKLLLIYMDLKTKKEDRNFLNNLPISLMQLIYHDIENNPEFSKYINQPEFIRLLHPKYRFFTDAELVKKFDNKRVEAIERIFAYLKSNSYEIILVIDNIDDFGQLNVKKIIDKAIDYKDRYNIKCILAVRDYWTPKNMGIDDSKLCAFHLSKPNIHEIIKNRLDKIDTSNKSKKFVIKYGNKAKIELGPEDVRDIFSRIVRDITSSNYLFDDLARLSNHDTRELLDCIYYFLHSPYLFSRPNFIGILIDKIKEIDKDVKIEKPRRTHFFDLLECLMAPHTLCYDISASPIFNIFYHNWPYGGENDYRNTLIFYRILNSVPSRRSHNTIKKQRIISELMAIGYADEKAIADAVEKLLKNDLLESPDGRYYNDVEAINLSAKGDIYLNILIEQYAYILYACDAVPMPESYRNNLKEKFGSDPVPLHKGSLKVKHESIKKFIEFLRSEEEEEEKMCPNGAYPILNRIRENEFLWKRIEHQTSIVMGKMLDPFRERKIGNVLSIDTIDLNKVNRSD
jgi:hypothetical protein